MARLVELYKGSLRDWNHPRQNNRKKVRRMNQDVLKKASGLSNRQISMNPSISLTSRKLVNVQPIKSAGTMYRTTLRMFQRLILQSIPLSTLTIKEEAPSIRATLSSFRILPHPKYLKLSSINRNQKIKTRMRSTE